MSSNRPPPPGPLESEPPDDGEGDKTRHHPSDRAELLRADSVCDGPRGCDRQNDGDERGRDAHRQRSAVPRVPSVRRPPIESTWSATVVPVGCGDGGLQDADAKWAERPRK